MSKKNIAILGGGNLGVAIAKGLMKSTLSKRYEVTVTRRNIQSINSLKEIGVNIQSNNKEAVENADLIILAVQPKQLDSLLGDIKSVIDPKKHTVVSVITGITIADIAGVLGMQVKVIRAMPNTAIAIGQSMTCIASANASSDTIEEVKNIFESMGRAMVIDEKLMQAATVLGACGIAFFLRFIRAASQGGTEVGFHAEEAQLIASQTALGAASLLLETNQHPEEAIDKVTTPQGCTIAGLNEMEHHGLSSALIKGIVASYKKIDKIT